MPSSTLDPQAAYRALVAHDARFDGHLFVGVTSTGIYCRPVCRVRTPLRQHCCFFASAAGAEGAGFRPCLRCRPELAPGLARVDSPQALARHAARSLERAARDGRAIYLGEVAAELGVTERHLRRSFAQLHGVSPIDYLTTQRLLLAKQLLTDTALPVTQVALASGYASLRRFNHAFVSRYRLNPSALRRAGARAAPAAADGARVRLGWRPPCDAQTLLGFFARRAIAGVELADASGLRRTLALDHQGRRLAGWIAARFDHARHELELHVSGALVPALGVVVARTRHALDLDTDPAQLAPMLQALAHTHAAEAPAARATAHPGLRVPGSFDGFETAARVILGQQITVAAARTLAQRLVERFGSPIETPFADLNRLFPDAATIAAADPAALGTLGIVRQRVGALQALARALTEGRIALHAGAPLAPTLQALRALPGIGEWTVQLIALRVLGWPDAFPATDVGVLRALGTRDAAQAERMAQAWRPWRAYAVIELWQTLENPP